MFAAIATWIVPILICAERRRPIQLPVSSCYLPCLWNPMYPLGISESSRIDVISAEVMKGFWECRGIQVDRDPSALVILQNSAN